MEVHVDLGMVATFVGTVCGAILGAATVYTRVTRPLRTLLSDVRLLLVDFRGAEARPGVRAVPGVLERQQAMEDAVTAIQKELRTNGGRSLRDVVLAMAAQTRVMSGHVGAPVLPPTVGEVEWRPPGPAAYEATQETPRAAA